MKAWWESNGVKALFIGGYVSGLITVIVAVSGFIPDGKIKYFLLAKAVLEFTVSYFGKQLGNAISTSPTNSTTKEL